MEKMKPQPMKCPICQAEMTRKVTLSTEIDLCAEHGVWLDKGELQKIISSIRGIYTQGMAEQRKQGRIEGIFYDWWSLLLPKK